MNIEIIKFVSIQMRCNRVYNSSENKIHNRMHKQQTTCHLLVIVKST